jgi:hypothetical protein
MWRLIMKKKFIQFIVATFGVTTLLITLAFWTDDQDMQAENAEKDTWCKDFKPGLTREQCDDAAGW